MAFVCFANLLVFFGNLLILSAFPVDAAWAWNTLPHSVSSAPPLPTFRHTYFIGVFTRSFVCLNLIIYSAPEAVVHNWQRHFNLIVYDDDNDECFKPFLDCRKNRRRQTHLPCEQVR